jgi:hypothetical protein
MFNAISSYFGDDFAVPATQSRPVRGPPSSCGVEPAENWRALTETTWLQYQPSARFQRMVNWLAIASAPFKMVAAGFVLTEIEVWCFGLIESFQTLGKAIDFQLQSQLSSAVEQRFCKP